MKYFTHKELCRSTTADKYKIANTPDTQVLKALTELTEKLLDPIREKWGKPINVNSGYRCPRVNALVGGKPSSQHLRGMAADITVGSTTANKLLYKMIKDGGFDYDQLIDESNYKWIHISYDWTKPKQRHMAFKL